MRNPDPIAEGREQFSYMLRAWQARGGWAQDTPARLAAALGWRFGPHNSQWSLAVRNRLDPKPVFFHSLGWLNEQVAQASRLEIDARLKLRVVAQQPIRHEDSGELWDAADFAACYLGKLEPPVWVREFVSSEVPERYPSDGIRSSNGPPEIAPIMRAPWPIRSSR